MATGLEIDFDKSILQDRVMSLASELAALRDENLHLNVRLAWHEGYKAAVEQLTKDTDHAD